MAVGCGLFWSDPPPSWAFSGSGAGQALDGVWGGKVQGPPRELRTGVWRRAWSTENPRLVTASGLPVSPPEWEGPPGKASVEEKVA